MTFENWGRCNMWSNNSGKATKFHVCGSPHDPITNYILETSEKKFGENVRFYDTGSSYSIEATRTAEQNSLRLELDRMLDSMADTTQPTLPQNSGYGGQTQYQNQVQVQVQGQGQVQAQVQIQSQGPGQNQGQAQAQNQGQDQVQNQNQNQPQTQNPNVNQGPQIIQPQMVPLSQRTGYPRVFFQDDMNMYWFFPMVGRDRWWDDLNVLIKQGRGPWFFLKNNIRNALLPNAFSKTPPLFPPYPAKI